MAEESNKTLMLGVDSPFAKLPDHLLIEIFVRVPIVEWGKVSCVNKYWANLFRQDCLWHALLIRSFPFAASGKSWPGPIPRGITIRRRFEALYVSKTIFPLEDELSEIVGHAYLFLKEQLEVSSMPPSSGILHGTIIVIGAMANQDEVINHESKIKKNVWTEIYADNDYTKSPLSVNYLSSCGLDNSLTLNLLIVADQFIACGKSRNRAHELATLIWLAVIDNLEDNHQTFLLLKRLALEGEVFLPYPYSRSYKVEWKIFERVFTDFRDCLQHGDYYDLLSFAKQKFQPIPATWLGY